MTTVSIREATGLKPVWIVAGIGLKIEMTEGVTGLRTVRSVAGIGLKIEMTEGATGLRTVRIVAATGSTGGRTAVVVELPTVLGSVERAQIAARVVAGN